jgi:hypothetical protein
MIEVVLNDRLGKKVRKRQPLEFSYLEAVLLWVQVHENILSFFVDKGQMQRG